MVKYGILNCVLPEERVFSDEVLDDILLGKRALVESLATYKSHLSYRVKNKGKCGFHTSKSAMIYESHFMLYNKNFDKRMKEKIDFKYAKI